MNRPAWSQKISNLQIAISLLGAAAIVLPACVTVNVNFPEGAVQKATDDFVKDLYRSREKNEKDSAEKTDKTSKVDSSPLYFELIASASAEETFVVKTPATSVIKDRMSGRIEEVKTHKRAGALGETSDGMLEVHDPSKVNKLQMPRVQALVSAENADRKSLYAEVLKANGMKSDRMKDLQARFARSFQAEAPSGTWVQEGDGKWSKKP